MNKSVNIKYMLSHFFLHTITCIVYGYGVYSLKERGYSSSVAGECLALCAFLAFFLQAYLANFVDNSKKLNIFDVSIICASIIFVFSIINSFLKVKSLLLTIVFVVFTTIYIASEPLINTLYTKFEVHGIHINFSTARSCGSFSYALFCFIFGTLTEKYSYTIVLYFSIALALSFLIDLILLKIDYNKVSSNKEITSTKVETVSYKEFIKNNKLFVLLILFLSMIYFGYLVFDNFMLLVIENVGGNSGDMGIVLGVKAVIEFFGICFIFPFLSKRTDSINILKIAGIMFTLKAILSSLATSVYYFYPIQILQAFAFSLMYPGLVNFVSNNLKKHEVTRGQALITMAMVFGSFFASLIAGNIADLYSVNTMEWMGSIVSIIGTIGFIYTLNKVKKNA